LAAFNPLGNFFILFGCGLSPPCDYETEVSHSPYPPYAFEIPHGKFRAFHCIRRVTLFPQMLIRLRYFQEIQASRFLQNFSLQLAYPLRENSRIKKSLEDF